jgi:hypothetical protein
VRGKVKQLKKLVQGRTAMGLMGRKKTTQLLRRVTTLEQEFMMED